MNNPQNWPLFKQISARGHENLAFFNCPQTNLKAVIAVHDTTLGPALGGCRLRAYQSEDQALDDVLRLSEGMTYKNSVAGLNLGGGKACIIIDPKFTAGRAALFRRFGQFVDRLHGTYYTAEDMGVCVADIQEVSKSTNYCVGADPAASEASSGDPSPYTAKGVFLAIKSVAEKQLRKPLSELSVAVEGLGNVGGNLCRLLAEEGVTLTVTDTYQKAITRITSDLNLKVVTPRDIYSQAVDIFAPCAVGQTINSETVGLMKYAAICGAANNQISEAAVHKQLAEKKIVYCPDFVVNAGGVISVGAELNSDGWQEDWVSQKIRQIPDTLQAIIGQAMTEDLPTEVCAYQLAKKRIESEKSKQLKLHEEQTI